MINIIINLVIIILTGAMRALGIKRCKRWNCTPSCSRQTETTASNVRHSEVSAPGMEPED